MTYQPQDRRPIASRERSVWKLAATALAGRGVAPNAISLGGMLAACAGGIALAATDWVESPWDRGLWLAAGLLAQARLIANMLDGMVAVESGKASPLGELYNEVPDRVSDAALFLGLGYAAGSSPAWGFLAALAAVFTAYVRAIAKTVGAPNDYCGPLAKPQRMFVLTLLAAWMGLAPDAWQTREVAAPVAVLILIAVGSLLTAVRRLGRAGVFLRRGA